MPLRVDVTSWRKIKVAYALLYLYKFGLIGWFPKRSRWKYERVLRVFALSRGEWLSTRDVAVKTGMPPRSAGRLLSNLTRRGVLTRNLEKLYKLNPSKSKEN